MGPTVNPSITSYIHKEKTPPKKDEHRNAVNVIDDVIKIIEVF